MRGNVRSILAIAVVVATTSAATAGAITNGTVDGDGHPYAVALTKDVTTPGYFEPWCSGTLVAPRLVITAAHCLDGLVDNELWVSFESVHLPASSPVMHGTGYAAADPANYHGNAGAGTKYGNSELGFDLAVVVLDQDAPVKEFAKLPPAGLLTTLNLRSQSFTAVGYGIVRTEKTRGPNSFQDNLDPNVRHVATESFRSLQSSALTLSQNPAAGDGGICLGDSGGPHLLGDSDTIVAVTILGDVACQAMGRHFRLDTPFARTFLAAHGVPLP